MCVNWKTDLQMYIEIQRSKNIQGNPWTHAIKYRDVWVASSLLHVVLGRIAFTGIFWASLHCFFGLESHECA